MISSVCMYVCVLQRERGKQQPTRERERTKEVQYMHRLIKLTFLVLHTRILFHWMASLTRLCVDIASHGLSFEGGGGGQQQWRHAFGMCARGHLITSQLTETCVLACEPRR